MGMYEEAMRGLYIAGALLGLCGLICLVASGLMYYMK